MKYCSLQASVGKEIICAQLLPFTAQLFVKARDRKSAHVFVRFGVCLCVRAPEGGGCSKESDNPPSLSLARYLGIRTARKWQTTVKEQVLLGLRCVTEQTLPHQTGCLFCTLPLSSVTHYPNHTESPSCHMVIWMKLIAGAGINAIYMCMCVCPGWRQADYSSYIFLSFIPSSSTLASSPPPPPQPSFSSLGAWLAGGHMVSWAGEEKGRAWEIINYSHAGADEVNVR